MDRQTGEITRQFNQLIAQNHKRVMADLHNQYVKFSRELDDNSRQWDNVITDSEDVKDASGHTYHVAAGSNFYYGNGTSVVGSNSGDAPNVDKSR